MNQAITETAAFQLPVSLAASRVNKSLFSQSEVLPEFKKILKWCFIPILAFVVYWFVETYIVRASPRLVYNPAEFPCRVFGYSHYLVGMMFMLSSRKMKSAAGWFWFVGLLAVSAGICFIFYSFGGKANPVMVISYFLFFMVHGFRDMIFFYQTQTEDQDLERQKAWIFVLFQACVLLALFYFLVPVYFLYLAWKPKTYTPELKANIDALMPYLNFALGVGWIILAGSLIGLWRLLRKFPDGIKGFWRDDRPVLLVIIYTALIILASPLVGPWTYNLLILSHFVGWYFFASRRLSTLPKQAAHQDGLWKYVRSSVGGFQRLHLGLAAVFFILILINHYVFASTGVLDLLFSSNAFYYWTVIHVTISFAPKS